MIKRARWAYFLLIPALACLPRIVKIDSQNGKDIILTWPWSSCVVEFVNSVTGGKVSITFRPLWKFSSFHAQTDKDTESYYTSGTYEWNRALGAESEAELRYCSVQGIHFKLGQAEGIVKNGCMTAKIIWPPVP